MHFRPPPSAHAAAVGMNVAVGLSFGVTKYALRGFGLLLLALLRFSLVGGLFWVVCGSAEGRTPPRPGES